MELKQKMKGSFTVRNDKGMHTRPCTELVKLACGFQAHILLQYQEHTVNAKSLLGILMLAAPYKAEIEVIAEGEDAEEAVAQIIELADKSFYMKY